MDIDNSSSRKVIDCFPFYNELDLLKYRMETLNEVVDYFVVVEATHTHSGREKEMFFKDNMDQFDAFKDKIIHVIVDDFQHTYPNLDYNKPGIWDSVGEQWNNERYQRDSITRGLERVELCPDDLIIVTDLDEIPDPRTILKCKRGEIHVDIHRLNMDLYYYNLRNKFTNKWTSGFIMTHQKLKEANTTMSFIRTQMPCHHIDDGGWHLSYFGDSKFIKNKIMGCAHQENNCEDVTNIDNIESRVSRGDDLFNRSDIGLTMVPLSENKYLPINHEKLHKFH